MSEGKTILCYGRVNPTSLQRIPVEKFNKENEAAKKAKAELPWTAAAKDAEGEGKTFDQLSKAGQKKAAKSLKDRTDAKAEEDSSE